MRQITHVLNSAARKPLVAMAGMALVACSPALAAAIPADFQGNWHEGNDGAPACTPGDNGLVQVTSGEFTYPMAGNTVLSVEPVKLNVIRVTFRHHGAGDGAAAPRTVTEQWTLSHDEEHLLIEGGKGGPVNGVADLFRCVKADSAG